MIAALPMYDFPHLAPANDAFWAAIRAALGEGPETLTRDMEPWAIWRSPDLIFAQTCGLPFRAQLYGQLQVIGTPNYGLPGCVPGHYYSLIVTRRGGPRALSDFEEIRFALNEGLSQSGWGAAYPLLRASGVPFRTLPPTGSHMQSMRAVAIGEADVAAIDVVTWNHILRSQPGLCNGLQVIEQTRPTAGCPFVTRRDQDRAALAKATEQAIGRMDGGARMQLGLLGLVQVGDAAYHALPMPPPR